MDGVNACVSTGHGLGSVRSYSHGLIRCCVERSVAVVTLNRPARRNALNREMLVALREMLTDMRTCTDAAVVVFTGAGRAFCSGVDISAEGRSAFYRPPQQTERLYQEHGQDVVRAFQFLPQITIAAVNGPAVGWGTCLATCCDFRVVSEDASFRIPEIGFGMYYDVGCLYGLLALVGSAQGKRMTMLGEDIDATEALRIGLADSVVPAATLMIAADRLARRLLTAPSTMLLSMKRQLQAMTVAWHRPLGVIELELTTAYYGANQDRHEGVAAYMEGRRPLFSREPGADTLTPSQRRGEGGESHGLPSD